MKACFHKPAPGERDPERQAAIILTVLFVIAVLVGLFLPAGVTPGCVFHRLTGIPCLTCGMVRSWHLLLSGEWRAAFMMQPLIVILLTCTAFCTAYAWTVSIFQLPRLRLDGVSRNAKLALVWVFAALVLINWAYLIWMGI